MTTTMVVTMIVFLVSLFVIFKVIDRISDRHYVKENAAIQAMYDAEWKKAHDATVEAKARINAAEDVAELQLIKQYYAVKHIESTHWVYITSNVKILVYV